jgi:hypothetical protein
MLVSQFADHYLWIAVTSGRVVPRAQRKLAIAETCLHIAEQFQPKIPPRAGVREQKNRPRRHDQIELLAATIRPLLVRLRAALAVAAHTLRS